MQRIGITGGIGSGKSSACRLFALYGVPVYDCDARAGELMDRDAALIRDITQLLGSQAYKDGKLDRAWVAGEVFGRDDRLRGLNALVHPAVGRDFERWAGGQQAPYIVMESAIIFESGIEALVDRVVAVSAPVELRIERTLQRSPQLTRQAVLDRMARQMDDRERAERADFEIVNDGTHSLIEQVARLHKRFTEAETTL